MNTSGNFNVSETGEAEFELLFFPSTIKAIFVDGLPNHPHASCSNQQPDQIFTAIRRVMHDHKEKYFLAIRFVVSKPRSIYWKVVR